MIRTSFIIFILVICLSGCGDFFISPNENAPGTLFEMIIADPIPTDVTNLEGASLVWQGYEVYFRFNATEEFISKLLENHEEVLCESIKERLGKSESLKGYLDFWDVDKVKHPKCYKSKGFYSNKATHSGRDCILIDRDNNVVYYHGGGA